MINKILITNPETQLNKVKQIKYNKIKKIKK